MVDWWLAHSEQIFHIGRGASRIGSSWEMTRASIHWLLRAFPGPAARIFYEEVRSNEETDQTIPVVQLPEMGVIRLPESAFRAFWKNGISQAFKLQKKFFFQIEHFILQFFRMKMRDNAVKKGKNKVERKTKSELFARFVTWCLHHDLSIVYQAQASLTWYRKMVQKTCNIVQISVKSTKFGRGIEVHALSNSG